MLHVAPVHPIRARRTGGVGYTVGGRRRPFSSGICTGGRRMRELRVKLNFPPLDPRCSAPVHGQPSVLVLVLLAATISSCSASSTPSCTSCSVVWSSSGSRLGTCLPVESGRLSRRWDRICGSSLELSADSSPNNSFFAWMRSEDVGRFGSRPSIKDNSRARPETVSGVAGDFVILPCPCIFR